MSGVPTDSTDLKHVTYFRAPSDGRIIAMLVSAQFDEFEKFPPFVDTEEERQHLLQAYSLSDPETERRTKAHMTPDEWPLQVILLNRDPGAITQPHYHANDGPAQSATRHQILICQRGSARIGIYSTEGDRVAMVTLHRDDFVLCLEGHSVEFLEPDTRLLEIKQGPFPRTDADDKVDLGVKHG